MGDERGTVGADLEYVSPIVFERVMRPIEGDPKKSPYDMLEVRHAQTNDLLATCMMVDDTGLEKIADMLSAKRAWREANRLRKMVSESRRPKRG